MMKVSVQFYKIIDLWEGGNNDGCDDDVCDRWWEGVGGEINCLISEEKKIPKNLSKRYHVIPRITFDVAKTTKSVEI